MYVYLKTESNPDLWTVGFYSPDDKFNPDSDHGSVSEAVARVCELNGGESARRKAAEPVAPTLRDTFAMHALTGYISEGYSAPDVAARHAYEYADAMLAAREVVK